MCGSVDGHMMIGLGSFQIVRAFDRITQVLTN